MPLNRGEIQNLEVMVQDQLLRDVEPRLDFSALGRRAFLFDSDLSLIDWCSLKNVILPSPHSIDREQGFHPFANQRDLRYQTHHWLRFRHHSFFSTSFLLAASST